MLAAENTIPTEILRGYFRLACSFHCNKKWGEMSENELWRELCLCILSSNVPFELAKSAFTHLLDIGYLELEWITKTSDSQQQISRELSKPLYLPKKIDGSYRKYRFQNTRARDIAQAAKVIHSDNSFLFKLLTSSNSENTARDFLVSNITGIGLKEASHFLRNIGYSNQLAIIDSHVISFLIKINAVSQGDIKTITPKIYLKLERKLQNIASEHGLNLSVLDMAIWQYMRERE